MWIKWSFSLNIGFFSSWTSKLSSKLPARPRIFCHFLLCDWFNTDCQILKNTNKLCLNQILLPVYLDKLFVERLSRSIWRSRNLDSFTRRRRLSFLRRLSFFLSFLFLSALAGSSPSPSATLAVSSDLSMFLVKIQSNEKLGTTGRLILPVRLVLFVSNNQQWRVGQKQLFWGDRL